MKPSKIIILMLCLIFVTNIQAQRLAKQVFVKEAGKLKEQLTEEEARTLTDLTIAGNVNAKDFKLMRDEMTKLESLDLSAASIRMYTGKEGTHPDAFYVYPKDCVPAYAFKGKHSLKKAILPPATRNLEDASFQDCTGLEILQIKKPKAPNLLPDALSGTQTAIFIPLGSKGEYRSKEKWAELNFVEGEPITVELQCTQPGEIDKKLKETGYRPEEISFLTLSGTIGDGDFGYIQERMINLVKADLKNCSAETIPSFTFSQKKYLTWVVLPAGLKVIGDRAFSGCIWLSGNIELPKSVNTLEYGAFLGCKRLNKLICKGSKPVLIGEDIFGTDSKAVIE